MRHLTDYTIQQYLDLPRITDREEVENHVAVCFECREKLEQYQELYQHLSVDSEPVPGESFNSGVLSALERIESKKDLHRLVQVAGALLVVALLITSLSYFGLITWQGLLARLLSASGKIINPLSETLGFFIEKLNGNLQLLAFAGLALLLFQLLDRSLLKHKVNRT